jgi:hypothetical protein
MMMLCLVLDQDLLVEVLQVGRRGQRLESVIRTTGQLSCTLALGDS